jgi:hypothetical protein
MVPVEAREPVRSGLVIVDPLLGMDALSNVDQLTFSFDGSAREDPLALAHRRRTGATSPAGSTSSHPFFDQDGVGTTTASARWPAAARARRP